MAKNFLVPINMNGLEIQNFLVQNLGTAPTGAEGQLYMNTTDDYLYYHDGTAWVKIIKASDIPEGASASTTTPNMDGTASVGTETAFARGDHVHPSDTSRVPTGRTVNGHALTGNVTVTNGDLGQGIGTCSTGVDTPAKVVTLSGYSLTTGGVVAVNFSSACTTIRSLNVNSKGAKYVKVGASTATSSTTVSLPIKALINHPVYFIYDGTNYVYLGQHVTEAGGGASGYMSASDKTAVDSIANKAPLASPAFTGTPTAPTAEAGTSTTQIATTAFVADAVSTAVGAVDAMRFKGTIGTGGTVTTLPTTGVKIGDTYRVITAGTYAGQTCEVGDLIIATATTPTWTVAQTNIDGAITSLGGTSPISVSGSGASRTIAHSTSGVTAGSKGDTSNQTPSWGSTFKALSGTVDSTGHLTAFAEHTVKIPNSTATSSANGLMSSTDKEHLNDVYSAFGGAGVYEGQITAGQTSCTIDCSSWEITGAGDVLSVIAVDTTNNVPVVIDWTVSGQNIVASIATAVSYGIQVRVILLPSV